MLFFICPFHTNLIEERQHIMLQFPRSTISHHDGGDDDDGVFCCDDDDDDDEGND